MVTTSKTYTILLKFRADFHVSDSTNKVISNFYHGLFYYISQSPSHFLVDYKLLSRAYPHSMIKLNSPQACFPSEALL